MEELKQWLVEEKSNPNVIDGMTELIKLNNEVKDASYSVESSAIELSDAILRLDRVFNPEKSKEDTYSFELDLDCSDDDEATGENVSYDETKKLLETIKSFTDQLKSSVQSSANGMIEQAKNTCVSIVQTGEESAREMIGQISFMAAFYQDIVHRFAPSSENEVNEWLNEMIDSTTKMVNGEDGILDEARNLANALTEKIQVESDDMVRKVNSDIQDVHENARQLAIAILGEEIGNSLADDILGIESQLPLTSRSGYAPRGLITGVLSKLANKVKDSAANAAKEVANKAEKASSMALDAAKKIASKAKEVANKVIEKEKDIGWKIGEKIP